MAYNQIHYYIIIVIIYIINNLFCVFYLATFQLQGLACSPKEGRMWYWQGKLSWNTRRKTWPPTIFATTNSTSHCCCCCCCCCFRFRSEGDDNHSHHYEHKSSQMYDIHKHRDSCIFRTDTIKDLGFISIFSSKCWLCFPQSIKLLGLYPTTIYFSLHLVAAVFYLKSVPSFNTIPLLGIQLSISTDTRKTWMHPAEMRIRASKPFFFA
jgi:hypothetical protein